MQHTTSIKAEIKREFRGCSGDDEDIDKYYNFIMASAEFINTMNYIYNSEITPQ